jgi:formylglycine-generating enzyme
VRRSLGRVVRLFALVASVTLLIVVLATSVLRAPGPPSELIEPQTGMILLAIEPGTFVMGSSEDDPGRGPDEARHTVTLTRRIFMGRDEVNRTDWAHVMGAAPDQGVGCGRCAVGNVNFYEVAAFITNLNAQSTSVRYRLPTEAEWEYACRAGSHGFLATDHQANAWGLHHMQDEAWEWTNDWYGPYDTRVLLDPNGPPNGTARVIRGGSPDLDASSGRCASRRSHAPQSGSARLGFRVVGEAINRGEHGFDRYLSR